MIARLIDSLRALAAREALDAHERALDFADAFLLASDCPQVRLTADQSDALQRVDSLLAPLADPARHEAVEWERVREEARAALTSLGENHETARDGMAGQP